MWRNIARNFKGKGFPVSRSVPILRHSFVGFSAVSLAAASLALSQPVWNDNSANSLGGVDVDLSIDPFPTLLKQSENSFVKSDHKLIASGVRSVTFLGFKVYGVGLYIPQKDESKIAKIVSEYLKSSQGSSVESLLNDKEVSQRIINDISQQVSYAVRITPVRNTDFGHLRDGLTKSILASPMTKTIKEEVGNGVEQLRQVFLGHRGSVPKNHSLWVVSDTQNVAISYESKKLVTEMGKITEPSIARVLLVLYLSNAKPLSEPLRKDFVNYVKTQV